MPWACPAAGHACRPSGVVVVRSVDGGAIWAENVVEVGVGGDHARQVQQEPENETSSANAACSSACLAAASACRAANFCRPAICSSMRRVPRLLGRRCRLARREVRACRTKKNPISTSTTRRRRSPRQVEPSPRLARWRISRGKEVDLAQSDLPGMARPIATARTGSASVSASLRRARAAARRAGRPGPRSTGTGIRSAQQLEEALELGAAAGHEDPADPRALRLRRVELERGPDLVDEAPRRVHGGPRGRPPGSARPRPPRRASGARRRRPRCRAPVRSPG